MWVTFRGHFSEWALQPKEYIFYTMSIPVYKHLYQNALEGYLKKKKKKLDNQEHSLPENVNNCKDALKSYELRLRDSMGLWFVFLT